MQRAPINKENRSKANKGKSNTQHKTKNRGKKFHNSKKVKNSKSSGGKDRVAICFHGNCPDGFSSASILFLFYNKCQKLGLDFRKTFKKLLSNSRNLQKINFQKDKSFTIGYGNKKCSDNIESIFDIIDLNNVDKNDYVEFDYPINFYHFLHNNEDLTIEFMEKHQNGPKKAKTLIMLGVSKPEFLFGRKLHQLYDEVIVIDHHETLWDFLEDEDLQDEMLEDNDININRVSKLVVTPSTTCTTQYLYCLLQDEFVDFYESQSIQHIQYWVEMINRGDTFSFRDLDFDDLSYKTGFYKNFLHTFNIPRIFVRLFAIFNTEVDDLIEQGKSQTKKELDRCGSKAEKNAEFFETFIDGQQYKGYYFIGVEERMGWLASMLAVKAIEEGVGRIGLGLRPPRNHGEKFRAVVRMVDPEEDEIDQYDNDDDLSVADICTLFGGGGNRLSAGCKIELVDLEEMGIFPYD